MQAASVPVLIELPATVSVAAWVIVALFGVIAWFLRREITNNDRAHREMNADIKKLLEGQGEIKGALRTVVERRAPSGEAGA